MPDKITPLLIGTRVSFDDRWQGRVSSIEADEDWNVFNIGVRSGMLFAARSVRLPFTSAPSWTEDEVRIAINSFHAFARGVPPVATPSRPLDTKTPMSHPGARFAGLIVRHADRRALEVILSRGMGTLYRVPIAEVSFTGKTMAIGVQPEQLVRYHSDRKIEEEIQSLIAENASIPTDDKRFVQADIEEGVATLSGNVRVSQTRDYIEHLVGQVDGVITVHNQIEDDFQTEAAIGLALSASGFQSTGRVYVRSNLGEILVDGSVPSQRAVEDVVRTVARVPGVRSVVNRLRTQSAVPA